MESGHTPNPHILVCYTTKEFASAMLDIERLEAGGAPRAPSARYEALAARRDRLMASYKHGELTRFFYITEKINTSIIFIPGKTILCRWEQCLSKLKENCRRKGYKVLRMPQSLSRLGP